MKKNNIIKYLGVSLFVFFGFLFSSCFGSDLTIQVDSCQGSTIENCLVDTIGNFNSNVYDKILYNTHSSPNLFQGWFWYSGHISNYFFGYDGYRDGRYGPANSIVMNNNYCMTGYLDKCNDFNLDYMDLYNQGNINLDSITWYDYDSTSSAGTLCLNSISAGVSYCFEGTCYSCLGAGGCDWQGNITKWTCISELATDKYAPKTAQPVSELAGYSPFVGGGGGDIPDIIGSGSTVLTNSAVALGLSYRYGYGENDCYGGYLLNDIFTADLDPANFTGFLYGSGASIYDIFNAYSGSYFTDINTFYNSFYSRYSIGNISSFWDYPKGLYSISQRAGFLGSVYDLYPVNMSNLVEFCDLKLKSDPDALYTGDNFIGIEGYYSLIGEVYDKRRYYDTDLFSGSDSTGSMSIDEFFTSVSNRLVAGLEDISDNRTGIIPTYILMVMMALILFRLISH